MECTYRELNVFVHYQLKAFKAQALYIYLGHKIVSLSYFVRKPSSNNLTLFFCPPKFCTIMSNSKFPHHFCEYFNWFCACWYIFL